MPRWCVLSPAAPSRTASRNLLTDVCQAGLSFFYRNGLRWRDSPVAYGPYKTLHNGWKRWSGKGIFTRMMAGRAAEHGEEKTMMIDAPCMKAHRTATSMGVKKGKRGRLIGRTKGCMNTKLHAICDS